VLCIVVACGMMTTRVGTGCRLVVGVYISVNPRFLRSSPGSSKRARTLGCRVDPCRRHCALTVEVHSTERLNLMLDGIVTYYMFVFSVLHQISL